VASYTCWGEVNPSGGLWKLLLQARDAQVMANEQTERIYLPDNVFLSAWDQGLLKREEGQNGINYRFYGFDIRPLSNKPRQVVKG
jgi:hypothetical protein